MDKVRKFRPLCIVYMCSVWLQPKCALAWRSTPATPHSSFTTFNTHWLWRGKSLGKSKKISNMKSSQGKSKFFSKLKFSQSIVLYCHSGYNSQLLTHIGCKGPKVWENPKKIKHEISYFKSREIRNFFLNMKFGQSIIS